ncbi:MAG: ABC transporter permease [bacterium]|uniref:ABC transporter permease n=1 Tax=Candidatus Methylomirabilis tolerans TaxID=3123416 RepID=A0AAJ1AHG4_9BACT|nr:ABC transporter permease [Candidatus Methylomirabilis sp.]
MFWSIVLLALRAIRRNILRSSLTILGIVIGVASVITMVTIGAGATTKVTADVATLGTNLVEVMPGQGPRPGGARESAAMFKIEDAEAIAREVSGLLAVAPVATRTMQAISGSANWSTTVTGSTNAYLQTRNWLLAGGHEFADSDLRAGSAQCILGATVRRELFGSQDPVGATIRLQKLSCQVIGVLVKKGQTSFGMDQDDMILVPLRMLQRRIAGNTDVGAISVSARHGVSTEKVQRDIERLLRERRRITPGKDDDFHVLNMQQLVSMLAGTTRVLTALLGAVATVSLLVGGIGIMNIMLVSVTERTREIGIRLAIGALEREVLMQFLVEAVVLSSLGGLVGIGLGLAAAAAGAIVLEVPFIFNPGIVVVAFVFSATVGIVFGFFPARQAARLDPIQALRYE